MHNLVEKSALDKITASQRQYQINFFLLSLCQFLYIILQAFKKIVERGSLTIDI